MMASTTRPAEGKSMTLRELRFAVERAIAESPLGADTVAYVSLPEIEYAATPITHTTLEKAGARSPRAAEDGALFLVGTENPNLCFYIESDQENGRGDDE